MHEVGPSEISRNRRAARARAALSLFNRTTQPNAMED
jgi:hypothetical protein